MILLSNEEIFICKLLYSDKKHKPEEFTSISFDNLIKVASGHLVIPLMYSKILEKKIQNQFPNELISYIRKIYEINKNRNITLIEEIKSISKIFKKNKIDHCFIKGSSLIINQTFKNIGDRMIGDIDILVANKDFKKAIILLTEDGYQPKSGKYINNLYRHYPRLIDKKKLFAVEIHDKLLRYNYENLLSGENLLKSKIKVGGDILIPNSFDELNLLILSNQINDWSYIKLNYSHRNIYDVFKLLVRLDYVAINETKYHLNYFNLMKMLGVNLSFEVPELNKLWKWIIIIINKNNLIKIPYYFIIMFIIELTNLINKIKARVKDKSELN